MVGLCWKADADISSCYAAVTPTLLPPFILLPEGASSHHRCRYLQPILSRAPPTPQTAAAHPLAS